MLVQKTKGSREQFSPSEFDDPNSTTLVAWTVKNSPTMQETWVLSLCWEDPLENGLATH